MGSGLRVLLVWVLGSALARIMTALGIAFTTYKGLDALLSTAFAQVQSLVGGISGDLLAILSRFGFFEALSILASVMMSIAAIKMLKTFVGIKS